MNDALVSLSYHIHHMTVPFKLGYIIGYIGCIDKFSTMVFLENILQYYYIPTTGVADLQAPLNNMLQSS